MAKKVFSGLVTAWRFAGWPTSNSFSSVNATIDGVVRAPMHGSVVEIAVKAGDQIEKGDRVGVVEAMKMEHAMRAPVAGVIEKVLAEPGAQVAQGDAIAVIAGGD